MKKVVLKKRDAFDLAIVLSNIINEKSKEIDFKDIIGIQKIVSGFKPMLKDYSDAAEVIDEARKNLITVANKKIQDYRTEQFGKADFDEKNKAAVEEFSNVVLEDAKSQVNNNITPMYEALHSGIGEQNMDIELEEKQHTLVVANFEKFAKDIYLNKERMVEVYEALSSAK